MAWTVFVTIGIGVVQQIQLYFKIQPCNCASYSPSVWCSLVFEFLSFIKHLDLSIWTEVYCHSTFNCSNGGGIQRQQVGKFCSTTVSIPKFEDKHIKVKLPSSMGSSQKIQQATTVRMQKCMPYRLVFTKIDKEDEVEDAWTQWNTDFFCSSYYLIFLCMRKREKFL